jgi:hypothetical protein
VDAFHAPDEATDTKYAHQADVQSSPKKIISERDICTLRVARDTFLEIFIAVSHYSDNDALRFYGYHWY